LSPADAEPDPDRKKLGRHGIRVVEEYHVPNEVFDRQAQWKKGKTARGFGAAARRHWR
jgi:hypothetical protein